MMLTVQRAASAYAIAGPAPTAIVDPYAIAATAGALRRSWSWSSELDGILHNCTRLGHSYTGVYCIKRACTLHASLETFDEDAWRNLRLIREV